MRFSLAIPVFLSIVLAQAEEALQVVSTSDVSKVLKIAIKSKDGLPIYVEATGNKNGPHVIFAHGFACTTSAFDPLFQDKALLSSLYMVRYDTRGHGLTGKPKTAEGYTSDRYADDLKAIISAYKLDKPFFVGWSLGGAIAADIATNFPHPLPFSGLIWISGLPYMGDILPKVATPEVLGLLPGIQSTDNATFGLEQRIAFVETLSAHTDDVPLPIKMGWVGSASYLPPTAATLLLSRTQNSTRLKAEGAMGWPLLIVHGSIDRQINGSAVISNMTPLFKNIESHIIQGAGHIPFYDDEPTVSKYLLSFINRVVRAKSYP